MFQWWLESSDDARDKMYKILIPSGNVKHKKRSEILNFNSPLQTTEPYPISRMISSMMDFFFGKSTTKQEQMNHIIASLNKKSETLIVVPFVGSGSECVSAKKNNVNFIGFEINNDYIDIANQRLDENNL